MKEQETKSCLIKSFERIKDPFLCFRKSYREKKIANKSKIPEEIGHDEFYESYSKFSEGSPLND